MTSVTTFSSRQFNQDIGRAKRAAENGPVLITDRGNPKHVMLSYTDYLRIIGTRRSLVDALSCPGLSDIGFDPPRAEISLRPAEFD